MPDRFFFDKRGIQPGGRRDSCIRHIAGGNPDFAAAGAALERILASFTALRYVCASERRGC